jgi:mRNA interferase RelE/StbE
MPPEFLQRTRNSEYERIVAQASGYGRGDSLLQELLRKIRVLWIKSRLLWLTLNVTYSNIRLMYKVVTTISFAKALSRLPVNWQKRIVEKIRAVAADPYASHNNVSKLQGRDGYRLRIGDWRVIVIVIYELHDDRLELRALEVGTRGGIY